MDDIQAVSCLAVILNINKDGGKGERKKEGRIKCKHTSFILCVCASNENAGISA